MVEGDNDITCHRDRIYLSTRYSQRVIINTRLNQRLLASFNIAFKVLFSKRIFDNLDDKRWPANSYN